MTTWLSISVDTSSPATQMWHRAVGRIIGEQADEGIVRSLESLGMDGSSRSSFVIDFDPRISAPAAYVDPASISESSQANWAAQSTRGRHEPTQTFVGKQPRTVCFTVHLQTHGRAGQSAEAAAAAEVASPALWLDALKYPYLAPDGRPYPPPAVLLRIANVIEMRCVVTRCAIRWKAPWYGSLPGAADIDLAFTSTATGFAPGYQGITRNYAPLNRLFA